MLGRGPVRAFTTATLPQVWAGRGGRGTTGRAVRVVRFRCRSTDALMPSPASSTRPTERVSIGSEPLSWPWCWSRWPWLSSPPNIGSAARARRWRAGSGKPPRQCSGADRRRRAGRCGVLAECVDRGRVGGAAGVPDAADDRGQPHPVGHCGVGVGRADPAGRRRGWCGSWLCCWHCPSGFWLPLPQPGGSRSATLAFTGHALPGVGGIVAGVPHPGHPPCGLPGRWRRRSPSPTRLAGPQGHRCYPQRHRRGPAGA